MEAMFQILIEVVVAPFTSILKMLQKLVSGWCLGVRVYSFGGTSFWLCTKVEAWSRVGVLCCHVFLELLQVAVWFRTKRNSKSLQFRSS